MAADDIRSAIEALREEEYERLLDKAVARAEFRYQKWAILLGFAVVASATIFALRWVVFHCWPGSYLASGLALAIWVALVLLTIRLMLSLDFSMWLVNRAVRREFKRGGWSAP
jgi:hypothetical protein